MFKRKVLVSLISIILSLFIFPFILGIEYSGFQYGPFELGGFFKAYFNSFMWFGLINSTVLLAGIAVTFISGVIIKKIGENKFIVIVNLLIHLIPGIIILLISIPFPSEFFIFQGIPLLVGAIFFAVDELLQWKIHKFNGLIAIILVPFILWGVIVFPSMLDQAEDKKHLTVVKETPIPEVVVTYNGEKGNLVNLSDCWEHENSVCEDEKDPFLLPIDSTGLTEYEVRNAPELKVTLKGTEEKYKIRAYYEQNGEIKKANGKGNKIKFPSNLQEQAVRVIVHQDNDQRLSFHIGFRTGIRE